MNPNERLAGRELVFSINEAQSTRFDPEVFARLADLAVHFGGTHVQIGLPFRYGSWVLPDNHDPYAAWTNVSVSILRVCPPPDLQPWVSAEHADWCQQTLRAQCDILADRGLKAACHGCEPMWLPEGVYRAHPHWRGVQCELGRIAARPYFAPSIDEPEVLDLYRRGMRQFSALFPEIDEFSYLSNDSGAGIAWTPNVYPGRNGPVRWRERDGGERLAAWLEAMQAGAADAGNKVVIQLHSSGFPPELTASARAKVGSGLFVRGGNRLGECRHGPGAGLPSGIWSPFFPAIGLGDPASLIGGLQQIYHNPDHDTLRCAVNCGPHDLDQLETALEVVMAQPGAGLEIRTKLWLSVAERLCGDRANAESLIAVWRQVATAMHAIQQIRQKGFGLVLPFCGVSMRWLVRPLVPEPERLTPDETRHYRDFVFAAGDAKDDPDFGMVLGKSVFNGESVTWMARWCLHEAIGTLTAAQAAAAAIAERTEDAAAAARLRLYAARIGACACLAASARNTIMYKYALDIREQPQFGPNPMDYDDNIIYDQRALTLRKIAREELDNINELITLCEQTEGTVLAQARDAAEESVFMLGPDLLADLRRKTEIMLDHWQDYERLFPSTKVHDFEPAMFHGTAPST